MFIFFQISFPRLSSIRIDTSSSDENVNTTMQCSVYESCLNVVHPVFAKVTLLFETLFRQK